MTEEILDIIKDNPAKDKTKSVIRDAILDHRIPIKIEYDANIESPISDMDIKILLIQAIRRSFYQKTPNVASNEINLVKKKSNSSLGNCNNRSRLEPNAHINHKK